jgi:hypothetical protein
MSISSVAGAPSVQSLQPTHLQSNPGGTSAAATPAQQIAAGTHHHHPPVNPIGQTSGIGAASDGSATSSGSAGINTLV